MPKSEPLNEDEIKRAAELREWLETRMSELETEMNRLRDLLRFSLIQYRDFLQIRGFFADRIAQKK